ncbi:MAG: DUF192 domain-containing protein [Defluviicoccus sp.]|nr:MAG: DUF192 domain-containing protein [Defluviicoccus sp.]
MRRTRRETLALLAMAGAAAALSGQGPLHAAEEPVFPVSPLTIETARGRYQFMVEMAETPSTQRQGLQKRQQLAPDAGMLFNFHQPRPIAMWMKDTLIPLDMVFLDDRGVIINIAENTVPLSYDQIPSKGPVLAVLEVNAGTAARLNMRPGDRVYHAIFTQASRANAVP